MSPLGKLLLNNCSELCYVDIDRLIYNGIFREIRVSREQVVNYAKTLGLHVLNRNHTIMGMPAVRI